MLGHASGLRDELSQRRPECDLVDPGFRDGAGDRHQRRARLLRRPDRAESAWTAAAAPSRTRCGRYRTKTLSLPLIGSPSAPFATTKGRPRCEVTARSFVAVGKPAPPSPRSPLASTSAGKSIAPAGGSWP